MIPLINEEHGSYVNRLMCKKGSNVNTLMIKIIVKLKAICILQVNTEVLQIAYMIQDTVNLKRFL